MKRVILATTAAIALSAPAFAQSDADVTVMQELMERGYTAAQIETLTDAQMTELYIALTSEDESSVETIISGFGFGSDASTPGVADGDAMQMAAVDQVLVDAGYPEGTVERLSAGEVTELFIASTSEDATDVQTIIAGLDLDKDGGFEGDSDAAEFVRAELMQRGVDSNAIETLTEGEVTELYIALTSGDETDIREAITSALNS